jgi:hypothetical protein
MGRRARGDKLATRIYRLDCLDFGRLRRSDAGSIPAPASRGKRAIHLWTPSRVTATRRACTSVTAVGFNASTLVQARLLVSTRLRDSEGDLVGPPPTHDLAGVKAGLSDTRVERGKTLYSVYLGSCGALATGGSAGRPAEGPLLESIDSKRLSSRPTLSKLTLPLILISIRGDAPTRHRSHSSIS